MANFSNPFWLDEHPVTAMRATKRRAYFAFQFDDIMRVNNVRNAWKIKHPHSQQYRSFYDSSLWETRKLENEEGLKQLMRKGVEFTSAVCVLVGTETWSRRWVRYEIARSVIDGRGLLAIHLNNIRSHATGLPCALGPNPLDNMGVGKFAGAYAGAQPKYVLCEWKNGGWAFYQDHLSPVPLPSYLPDAGMGQIIPLSRGARIYDYVMDGGSSNIGSWIDAAARDVGR